MHRTFQNPQTPDLPNKLHNKAKLDCFYLWDLEL